MNLTSPSFQNLNKIPSRYTCLGDDINPPLVISDIPLNTQSLVLILDDPDAPMKTWVHWVVYNIPPFIRKIEENSVPEGARLGMTDFAEAKYGGPCPPSGTHRYFFKLYALETVLDIESNPTKEIVLRYMDGHVLDTAELVGTFKKF